MISVALSSQGTRFHTNFPTTNPGLGPLRHRPFQIVRLPLLLLQQLYISNFQIAGPPDNCAPLANCSNPSPQMNLRWQKHRPKPTLLLILDLLETPHHLLTQLCARKMCAEEERRTSRCQERPAPRGFACFIKKESQSLLNTEF